MSKAALLLAALLLAAPALAVTPKAVIVAPASAALGDLVVLDGGDSKADEGGLLFVLVGSTKTFLALDDKAVFASGSPGRYEFVLVAVGVVDGKPRVSIATHTLTIGGGPIPPGPGPEPDPGPGPAPPPDDLTGLALDVRTWAASVPTASRGKAGALASAFDAVVSQIGAGTLNDSAAIWAAINERVRAELTDAQLVHWEPIFFDPLDARCEQLEAAGTLSLPASYAVAFGEVVKGLRAVR